jgi:hypothetical protein
MHLVYKTFQGRAEINQILSMVFWKINDIIWPFTSQSAYVATLTESDGVKIDGFLYPNFI